MFSQRCLQSSLELVLRKTNVLRGLHKSRNTFSRWTLRGGNEGVLTSWILDLGIVGLEKGAVGDGGVVRKIFQ